MRAFSLLVAIAIAGCQETQHCDQGSSYQNGECRPTGDAALRADAPSDPCAMCTAPAQQCLRDAGAMPMCVECLVDADCRGSTGSDAGVRVCSAFHCVAGCNSDGDCASAHCTAMRRCSMYGRHQTSCQPCDSDENCDQGNGPAGCIVTRFAMSDDGGHCLPRSSTCAQPYATSTMRTSVDGAAGSYCVPNEQSTTCAAILDAIAGTACTSPATCAPRGADCQIVQTGGSMVCTYPCVHNADCPMGFACAPQTFCHM